jgi:hypothetical protein
MRYALKVKPRTSFPVHDGMMRSDLNNFAYTVYEKVLKERGSGFVPMGNGAEADF